MHLIKPVLSHEESIMIGDTMEVDILGAINAGIDQLHVNHLTDKPESINGKLPTHTVYSLKELEGDILEYYQVQWL